MTTSYNVVLTEQFVQSLDEATGYYFEVAHSGVADEFLSSVETAILRLYSMPLSNPVFTYNDKYRKVKAGKFPYLIFYTLVGNKVTVIDVVHGKKDLDTIFKP